jgi:hypothetical protein
MPPSRAAGCLSLPYESLVSRRAERNSVWSCVSAHTAPITSPSCGWGWHTAYSTSSMPRPAPVARGAVSPGRAPEGGEQNRDRQRRQAERFTRHHHRDDFPAVLASLRHHHAKRRQMRRHGIRSYVRRPELKDPSPLCRGRGLRRIGWRIPTEEWSAEPSASRDTTFAGLVLRRAVGR